MKQVFVSIANGSDSMKTLLEGVNRGQFQRHLDLQLPPNDLAVATDYPVGTGQCLTPLGYGHFNQAIKCLNYIHVVETLGWQDQPILLREADTWLLKPIDCPVDEGRIGMVRWKYANYNGGAIYIGRGAWQYYKQMVDELCASNTTCDEHIFKPWLSRNSHVGCLLDLKYNWDVRIPSRGDELLMHVTRRVSKCEPFVEEFLARYSAADLIARGRNCFGNYAEGYLPSQTATSEFP